MSDRFQMVHLGRQYHGVAGFGFPFNAVWAEDCAKSYIAAPDRCAFVAVPGPFARGMILGMAARHEFFGQVIAAETLWWVDPAARNAGAGVRLLEAFEAWAREFGAAACAVAVQRVGQAQILERRGYMRTETHLLKVF